MSDWVVRLIEESSYLGVAFLMFLETLFPPIPSEVVLPLAGYLVEQGDLTFAGALIASTVGSLVGAVALEEAARHGGRPFAERFVRFAHQDPAKLEDAERWFRRRGWLMVLAGRCVPGVRSLVALPAGVLRMPRGQYVVLTLIGSTVWNTLLISAGYVLGSQWERVSDAIGRLSTPLVIVAGLATVALVVWRIVRARRQ